MNSMSGILEACMKSELKSEFKANRTPPPFREI